MIFYNCKNYSKLMVKKNLLDRIGLGRFFMALPCVVCQNGRTAMVLGLLVMTLTAMAKGAGASGPLVVGEVHIQTRDIFSPDELAEARTPVRWLRRGMNGLHVNTRRYVLRQEILFHEGEDFNPAALAETERNLRSLGFLNEVRVAALDTTPEGRVNILVSARESWTLNTALTYTRASGNNQRWSASLSDGNVLGAGFLLGAGLGSNELGGYTNLRCFKRRPFGSNWQLGAYYDQPSDGHRRGFTVARPFYAQDDRWGLELRFWDYTADSRYFLSNASGVGYDPSREASLSVDLPRSQTGLDAGFRVRLGRGKPANAQSRIWRLGAGLRITDTEHHIDQQPLWVLSDGRVHDLSSLLDSGSPLDRESGLIVYPYLHLETMGRRWIKRRFVNDYGPIEDLTLAWRLVLRIGPNGRAVGSTAGPAGEALRTEAYAARYLPLLGGLAIVQGSGIAQTGARDHRTHRYNVLAGWTLARGAEMEPWLTRVFAEWGQGRRLTPYEVFRLGLDRGIRTLEFDGMAGDRLARWNVEQGKVFPWTPLGLFRSGAAVFYSGGCAWFGDESRDLADARHELGVGMRFGPVRSSHAQTTRIDLTWNARGLGSGPVLTTTTRGTF